MGSVSRLLKNTTVLLASNFATKGLSVLFIVYLARYLEDYGFGQYTFALSFAAIFIIFSDMGLDALTIKNVARDRNRAGEYLESVGVLRFGLSLIMISVSLAAAMVLGLDLYLIQLILVSGCAYLFDKMSGLFYAIFRAQEKMELEAATQIIWKSIQIGLGFCAIYFGFSLMGIMAVLLISSVIKTIVGFTILLKIGVRPSRSNLSQGVIFRDAMPFAAYEIGNAIYMNMAIILLFLLQSEQDTGWFSAGLRIIMFMLLIPSAFDAAIYPLFSRLYERSAKDMNFAYGKSLKWCLIAAIPVAICLAILSREVASVFGSGFDNTADILFVMAALLPLYTVNMLMKTALWSGDAQKQIAVNIWIALAIIAVTSYVLISEFKPPYIGAALAIVIAESSFLILNFRDAHRKGFPMGRFLGKPVIAGLFMIGSALGLNAAFSDRIGSYHMALLTSLVYLLAILLMGVITRSDRILIKDAISRRKP